MFDYHVHTSFSADCEVSINTMLESAIKKGILEIAITDHVDYEYPDISIDFSLDFDAYHKALDESSKKYQNHIQVVKGLEVGLQHHVLDKCNDTVCAYPYDFIIASFHAVDKRDLHNGNFFEDRKELDAYLDFYSYSYSCLKSYKSYNIIGHLNLIDRYKKYMPNSVKFTDYADIIEAIFKMIIQEGKGIEVNTASYRYNMEELSPTIKMLQLYKELHGEIITVGSDAHTPDYIAHQFDYIYDLLKTLGFKYISTFKNMSPKFIKL